MEANTVSKPLKPLWEGFNYMEHQTFGIRWMIAREKATDGPQGGILADDMGLGKTIQIAGLIKNNQRKMAEQVLLVTPVAVLHQWKAVLHRAGMTVKVPLPKSTCSWRVEHEGKSKYVPQVHVVGYEYLLNNRLLATPFIWDRVVFDEAHRLNGPSVGLLTFQIKRTSTWLLTGTPVVNSIKDLNRLFAIVGIKTEVGVGLNDAIIKQYVLARNMDQLRASIPDAPPVPVSEVLKLDFNTDDEAEFYRGMTGFITRRWAAIKEDGGTGSALATIQLYMRLRQLSLHPQVYISARKKAFKNLYTRADWTGSSTKFDAIRGLIEGADAPHKWLLFCHFHEEMDLLEASLKELPAVGRIQKYNGALSHKEKEAVLAETMRPCEGQEVLIIQLQSGGVGINLQHFDRIIFSGPWWTKALMDQAVARAVRIGQKKVVRCYHLVLKEEEALNIDKKMVDKATEKGLLCKAVLAAATKEIGAGSSSLH
jgi:transcription termination factor 2